MRILFALILFQVLSTHLMAQQNLVYNHYFLDPYLFNPSFIAPNGYSELNLNFRKQWASFEGSPTTLTANLQVPINHKMGYAFNLYNDRAGVLQTNTGAGSFSYQVYLGQSTEANHKIGFGLSLGYSMSQVDLSKVDDPNDPSLANNNTSNLVGQFGMHYQLNNLKIGFALPSLFATKLISEDAFNSPGLDALKNTFSSISYNVKFSDRLAVEPYFIYRTNEIKENQFEALAIVKIDNQLWVGGSYRQDYGPSALLGFTLKEKLKIGYAYEFAPEVVDGFGSGSHELHVSLRIGKKEVRRPAPAKTEPEAVLEEEKEPVLQEQAEPQKQIVETPIIAVVPAVIPGQVKPEESGLTKDQKLDLAPGFYVIVGTFKSSANATKYANELKASGYSSTVAYSALRNFSYIHVGNFETLEAAQAKRAEYRLINKFEFRATWILNVK